MTAWIELPVLAKDGVVAVLHAGTQLASLSGTYTAKRAYAPRLYLTWGQQSNGLLLVLVEPSDEQCLLLSS